MSDSKVFRVGVENISPLWPQIAAMMDKACKLMSTHAPEDVRRQLLTQESQLWLQWSDRPEALIVSQFAAYPNGLWLRLWLGASADGCVMDRPKFVDALEAWRTANQCREYEIIGRMGWGKLFPKARMEACVWRGLP